LRDSQLQTRPETSARMTKLFNSPAASSIKIKAGICSAKKSLLFNKGAMSPSKVSANPVTNPTNSQSLNKNNLITPPTFAKSAQKLAKYSPVFSLGS
jgi:hypothetical protein